MRPDTREGQTIAGESLLARYASFVKLPHTFFALPFAGVGAVLASYAYAEAVTWRTVLWILVAFTAARFAAMGFNRIADRHLDARNPRTRERELPAGRLSLAQAWVAVLTASAVFVSTAWQLNPLCGQLAPAALLWVFFYSYTKRFTAGSHYVMGFALGMAPVGAYLALAGEWSAPWYSLVALAVGVAAWAGGFDIIYAVQDVEFDREHDLRSLPARLGVPESLRLARLSHLIAVALFFLPWALDWFGVGWLYLVGVVLMAGILHYEHRSVRGATPETMDLGRVNRAFFRANVGVSAVFFAFTLLDRLVLA